MQFFPNYLITMTAHIAHAEVHLDLALGVSLRGHAKSKEKTCLKFPSWGDGDGKKTRGGLSRYGIYNAICYTSNIYIVTDLILYW